MLASPSEATKSRRRYDIGRARNILATERAGSPRPQKSASPPTSCAVPAARRARRSGWRMRRRPGSARPADVEMWRGLDLPAWQAPYVLRDARLGYLNGYERALVSGEMSEEQISNAAEVRWGGRWREKLREHARGPGSR